LAKTHRHLIKGIKITTVLDSKSTKSVGHFEENKFSVGSHQFLLDWYSKLIKTFNLDNFQSIKDNSKTKMNNIVQSGCLFSKLLRFFVDFLSTIVSIFYRVHGKKMTILGSLPTLYSGRFLKKKFFEITEKNCGLLYIFVNF
jgi:hypothetical protein